MRNVVYLHNAKKPNVVLTDELLDYLGENYQTREEKFQDMTFEQYVRYELWTLSK